MPAVSSNQAASTERPAALGRYRVLRELGRGAQGCVYLAHDEHLGRDVAIKTLALARDPARQASLLAEARTIAGLQHPNIVTLHDAFQDQGLQCLVLEYVAGDTLQGVLRTRGPYAPAAAVAIAIQVLDALAYAHERGIVHRDIKPANIMIDAGGIARIMDFGIAAMAGRLDAGSTFGTPRYMAPESIESREVARCADVFAVGMTLYEMLTGRPAVEGRNVFEILHKIANQPFQPPSAANGEVPEALDQIVMRAAAKDPADRYADAQEMRRALAHYAEPHAGDPVAAEARESGGAIDFLLARMRHKPGFPALSGTISAINRVTTRQEQNVNALSEVLLKDFALTNKLLRMVNSSSYGQFGGTISTISRAVMILGFDAVRDLAVTLVLFDHLHNKGQASKLREDVIKALFTGIVARRFARSAGLRDVEEGFVGGVFRNFGRLLAEFYLYEESVEVARRIDQAKLSEESASKAVLGASYSEIGMAVAKSWNLPSSLVEVMRPLEEKRPARPTTPQERLRLTAAIADELGQAVCAASPAQRERELDAVAARFSQSFALDAKQLKHLAGESVQELLKDAASLLGDSRKSRFCQALAQAVGAERGAAAAGADTLEAAIGQTAAIAATEAIEAAEAEPAQVLAAGVQDITNSLVDDFNLSDLLRIILETMYRGMRFGRVLLFMRNAGAATLTARLGYGAELDRLVGRLCVPCGREQDVFSVVLAKNVDLLISDVDAENIRARIPDWFRKAGLGKTFVLLPVVIDGKAIGLFYGEKNEPGELAIQPREMNLLKTLRNQAVLAFRQRR